MSDLNLEEVDKPDESSEEVFEGKFGGEIKMDSKVIYSRRNTFTLSVGTICKITEQNVYVDTGHGGWLRRRIKKDYIPYELISLKSINHEEDNSN